MERRKGLESRMKREKMMNACTRDKEISGTDKQARERERERDEGRKRDAGERTERVGTKRMIRGG